MCFIHLFVASSCHGSCDEAIIGQVRLLEIGFRDCSSELFTCWSKDDYWIWDFTQGHEDEPEGDKRSSFWRIIIEHKFWDNFSVVYSIIWSYCEYESRQAIGRSYLVALVGPSLFGQRNTQQYIHIYIAAHSSTTTESYISHRLVCTVRQSESCGNACFIWCSLALNTLDKKLVISTPTPLVAFFHFKHIETACFSCVLAVWFKFLQMRPLSFMKLTNSLLLSPWRPYLGSEELVETTIVKKVMPSNRQIPNAGLPRATINE